jgi:hypothetical protein
MAGRIAPMHAAHGAAPNASQTGHRVGTNMASGYEAGAR